MRSHIEIPIIILVLAQACSCGSGHTNRAHVIATAADDELREAAADEQRSDEIVVCDQRYWVGPEGNRAVAVTAKFREGSQLARTLDLSRPIGELWGRSWTLADVLVDLDTNANGHVATWRVSGPTSIVSAYVENLTARADTPNSGIYEFQVRTIEAQPTGEVERDEG